MSDVWTVIPTIFATWSSAISRDEEAMDIIMSYGKGILFFARMAGSGADWRYTGRGVQFGEADKVVFWYRMPDASSYRAIYGDLHVEDVSSPDLLP
ncbi:MAG: hypothetical protein P8Y80_15020 [Acidobacteriota bacterium]